MKHEFSGTESSWVNLNQGGTDWNQNLSAHVASFPDSIVGMRPVSENIYTPVKEKIAHTVWF